MAVGYPEGSSCMTVMGVMVRNGCTYRANNTAVCQWIYAYSCLAGKSATTFFLSIFSLTPWLVSLGFISICPHFASSCGSGVKAEMQTWKEDVCVSLCVFVCVRRREKELRGERKRKSEAVAKVAGGGR